MAKQKRIYIVHGWASHPDDCWMPWLKKELEKRGHSVFAPKMPNPKFPDINEWVGVLSDIVGLPDKDTYFVGHSLGCYIILKYLGDLETDAISGGIVCVGGKLWREGRPSFNEEKAKKSAGQIKAFFSDDDYYIPASEADVFKGVLNADVKILSKRGHFSRRENMTELSEVLEALDDLIV